MSPFILSLLSWLISVAVLLLIIGILVFVHELGHFLAAKFVGVKVNEFAIGFGKTLWQKQGKETLYKLNLLPLGGFVSLEGEDGMGGDVPSDYGNKSWPAKALILMGGITMNILMAIILFAGFLPLINYRVIIRQELPFNFAGAESVTQGLLITKFEDYSQVKDQLQQFDLIHQVNGEPIISDVKWREQMEQSQGQKVNFSIRNLKTNQERQVELTIPRRVKDDQGLLGVRYMPHYVVDYPHNVSAAVSHSWNIFAYQINVLVNKVQQSFQERDAGIVGEQLGSVVAVGVIVEDLLSAGHLQEIINLVALVSLSLAFFNLLPIPALDGGHLLIVTIESLTRRKFKPEWVNAVNQIGFVLLMGLGVIIIFKDVLQFELLQRLFNWLGSLFNR
jgi:regulator of sigma E protease